MCDKELDQLRQEAGLMFISDLCQNKNRMRVVSVLRSWTRHGSDLTMDKWNYMLSYVFRRPLDFGSVTDLNQYLWNNVV